jgi:copper chaperone
MSASGKGNVQTYRVEGMSCGRCQAAITQELTQVAGVDAVDVDLDGRLVRVGGSEVSDEAVLAAIDDAGYDGEPA